MLYLFNKVYIKPDTHFSKSKNSVIVSPKVELLNKYPDLATINKFDFGTVHYYAASYAELLEKNFENDEHKFFMWLLAFDPTKRLIVFCDVDTFTRLTFRWYKTILVNMDSTEAVNLISLVFKRYAYQFGYPYTPFVRLTAEQAAVYKSVGQSMLDPQQISDKWAQTLPFDIDPAQLATNAGIEFQLATYLANNTWQHKPELEAKVVMMVKKYTMRLLIDVKQELLGRLAELPGFDILNVSLLEYTAAHPEFSFLLDDNFLPDQYQYVYSTYNMADLVKTLFDQVERMYGSVDRAYLQENGFGNPNPTLDDIVQIELNRPFATFYLGQWDYAMLINSYLLAYIFDLSRTNKVTTLKKYSLEKA